VTVYDEALVPHILTMNQGSATLKAALYDLHQPEQRALSLQVDHADTDGGRLRISAASGDTLFDHAIESRNSEHPVAALFEWLDHEGWLSQVVAAGHRLVHGGAQFQEPRDITPQVLAELEKLIPLDPDHLPQALFVIRLIASRLPSLPQIACFDTAFHSSLPKVSRMYALPRQLFDDGIRRYGFHGLSYEYIVRRLRELDGTLAEGRVIVAHLGNGSSMVALRGGKSVDTTMGFTPLEGLVMGTRSGDVDPGALLYLLERERMSPQELRLQLNKQSGLLGVSGSSEDMRDLLERYPKDGNAAEAVDLFCYRARKYIGAYAAALGGLDLLVFTGGIGEHAAVVRDRICSGLDFLGIQIDPALNQSNAPQISHSNSRVKVRVIETNEESVIVRHVLVFLGRTQPQVP
jgi:acetate kinase